MGLPGQAIHARNRLTAYRPEASIHFTFWGLQRLQKGGLEKGPLSKMHMLGLAEGRTAGFVNSAGAVVIIKEMKHAFTRWRD